MFFSNTTYFKVDLRPHVYTLVPKHTHTHKHKLKKLMEVENCMAYILCNKAIKLKIKIKRKARNTYAEL